MATIIGDHGSPILFTEYSGDSMSQSESYENDKIVATRIFDIVSGVNENNDLTTGWMQRWHFIRSVFGWPEVLTVLAAGANPGFTYVSRRLPVAYPLASQFGQKMLWPKDVPSVRGMGPWAWQANDAFGFGFGKYERARVHIRYETRPYRIAPDHELLEGVAGDRLFPDEASLKRYVEKSYSFISQALTLPRGGGVWASDSVVVDDSNIRIVPHIEVTYIWHQVPGIPSSILGLIGRVNTEIFDGFPVETLLLTGCELRPYRWVTGQRVYDIKYKMRYFQPEANKGHNHFLRYKGASVTPVYERILAPGAPPGGGVDEGIFKKGDMKTLFRPPLVDLVKDW